MSQPSTVDPAQAAVEQDVTERVVASFADAPDPRYREVMTALVRYVHAFLRETRLTEAEWTTAIEFLRRCGDITTDTRQEFILLSDVLGVSMQTIAVSNPVGAGVPGEHRPTDATVFGPFFVDGSPEVPLGGDVAHGAKGVPCGVEGSVTDTFGRPVPGARLEVWEADQDGYYDVQRDGDGDDPPPTQGRGHLFSGPDGTYGFWCVLPSSYPIPHDGPVGDLLAAARRSPYRPAHLHFMVSADGLRTLVTHVFVAGDPYLGSDAVFGVKDSLVLAFHEQPAGDGPAGRRADGTWFRTTFDIVLAPAPGAAPEGSPA
jgi:hydroxyquinol 1,2-dioxygenase